MTVQAGPTDKRYAANGVTAAYTIPFLLIKADDLQVYLNDTQVTSGFTLTGLGAPNSTITFNALSIPTGDLYLLLNVPFERLTDYQENGEFRAATVNLDFDRIWQAIKQLGRYASKALSLGVNDIDGQGSYRANNNRIQDVHDPVQNADATNKLWVQQYIGGLLAAGQGPANTAANVLYVRPDGTTQTVQDLAGPNGATGIGFDGRDLADSINWNAVAYLAPASDFSAQLQDFANNKLSGAVKTGTLKPGVRRCLSQITFPADVNLNLHGVTLDFSEASSSGSFPNMACVVMGGGTFTPLPALTVAPAVATYQLTFASAPNLKSGDIICIWNPADFSFSGFRANYYAGEFAQVRYRSGNTVLLSGALLSAYPTTVQLFKLGGTSPVINGGTIVMPESMILTAGIFCELSRGAHLTKVNVLNTSGAGIVIERSVNAHVEHCGTSSNLDSVAQDNYGLCLSNVQNALVLGGTYNAKRHAVTMGGNGFAGCVPTRNAKVIGADLSSWDIQCADMHGNVEFSTYQNCTLRNGVTISGNNNSVRGGTIFAPANASTGNGVAIAVNEMRGTNFQFEDLNIIAFGDPSTTSRAVIDIGGNSTAMSANTLLGGCLSFRNINMSAPNARVPFKCINAGSTAPNKSIVYDVKWIDAPATRTSNFWAGVSSGTNFSRIDFKGMRFNDLGAPSGVTANADLICGLRETGTATITTVASSGVQNFNVAFTNRFPKAPVVTVTPNRAAPGPLITTYVSAADSNGFTISIIPASGTTTAGVVINVAWTASLDE